MSSSIWVALNTLSMHPLESGFGKEQKAKDDAFEFPASTPSDFKRGNGKSPLVVEHMVQ